MDSLNPLTRMQTDAHGNFFGPKKFFKTRARRASKWYDLSRLHLIPMTRCCCLAALVPYEPVRPFFVRGRRNGHPCPKAS